MKAASDREGTQQAAGSGGSLPSPRLARRKQREGGLPPVRGARRGGCLAMAPSGRPGDKHAPPSPTRTARPLRHCALPHLPGEASHSLCSSGPGFAARHDGRGPAAWDLTAELSPPADAGPVARAGRSRGRREPSSVSPPGSPGTGTLGRSGKLRPGGRGGLHLCPGVRHYVPTPRSRWLEIHPESEITHIGSPTFSFSSKFFVLFCFFFPGLLRFRRNSVVAVAGAPAVGGCGSRGGCRRPVCPSCLKHTQGVSKQTLF